jgi:predicted nucleic acid-binding protein
MRLLDTDVLVDLFREYEPAVEWLNSLDGEDIAVPGYVALEMVQGCRSRRDLRRVERMLAVLPTVWPSADACEQALELCARYFLSHNQDAFDALIAATAVASGATLRTFNVRHFRAIGNLRTEQTYRK